MGAFRDAVFERLRAADRYRRLRIVYPIASRTRDVPTFVHSKVMVVDDQLVRIGSANFARRSMGMDTECDLAVEAAGDRRVRAGSLIDSRQTADRTLTPVGPVTDWAAVPSATLRATLDPGEPIGFGPAVEHLLPPALWIGTGAFLTAGLLLVPLELLTVAAAVAFGALRGGMVAAIGSLALAVIGYLAGRAIGAAGVARWISRRSYRSARQLGAQGVVGVIVLRLSSVAGTGAINLLCGAGRGSFVSFIAGTVIGVAPAIVALSALGGLLRDALVRPSMANGLATIGAAVLLLMLASAMRTLLLIRQFAPSVAGHRERAEFG